MKNDTVIILALVGLAAWAFYRSQSGHTALFGGSQVTTRQATLHDWLFSLPTEIDWRSRPEFNTPDVFGDIVQSSILTLGNAVTGGVGGTVANAFMERNR